MPSINKLSCTLLASTLLVLVATPQSANALSNSPYQAPHAARHAHVGKRMVKRFAAAALPAVGDTGSTTTAAGAAAAQPAAPTTTSAAAAAGGGGAAAAATTTAAADQTTTAAANAATTTTTSADNNIIGGLISNIVPGSSSTTATAAASTASTSSAAATTSSAAPTSNTVAAASTPATSATPTSALPASTARASTVSVAKTAASATATSENTTSSSSSIGKNTMIAIAVIAGSIGGAAAIWTLIRKWKLGPSSRFEERMQPIEWNPDGGSGGSGIEKGIGGADEKTYGAAAAGVVGANRLGRSGSTGSQGSSFRSGEGQQNLGRNVTGNANMNMFAEHEVGLPPPHDFTAGPSQVPYGAYDNYNAGPGYVDLQRNVSGAGALARQPSNGAGLSRGPSNGGYAPNAYGHEQQAYEYGHEDAYAQDAYGGYDAQPAAHQPYVADPYAAPDPYANHAAYQGAQQGARY
ncbi:hypothetical protein FRB94_000784 [Tulasnella sp. JGI-2019a]|nr:hypothetical protein FRB93_002664 [Tulasnella sp. JGI-2019a]KAG9013804.1 hypothetical protein FRB94_000784 [Tulasnella sp. JGI-2019a]KAG9038834.1 hypothetical protein FRB95_014383 [Tulasnella sp. JGI-2019a]